MYLTEEEIGAQKGLYSKTTQFKSCRARFQMKPSKRTGRILVYCSLIEKKKKQVKIQCTNIHNGAGNIEKLKEMLKGGKKTKSNQTKDIENKDFSYYF